MIFQSYSQRLCSVDDLIVLLEEIQNFITIVVSWPTRIIGLITVLTAILTGRQSVENS